MLDSEDHATVELRGADAQLTAMIEALRARGFSLVRRNVYRDESGDGTGDMGWLWLRADPPLYPEEPHDCVVRYSEADDNWQISLPGGRGRQVSGSGDTSAVAVLIAAEIPRPPELSARSGAIEVPAVRDVTEWVAMILGSAATSVVLPFVQALVGKSAEEAYTSLRDRLRRRSPSGSGEPTSVADPSTPAASEYLSVIDPESDLHLVVPDPIPAKALRHLAAMDQTELHGRTLVWDESREEWLRCRRA
ncbi:hypothetical protein [Streptomyces jeddahensis]|uniref:hypothetical protein n=1 Tax=Streptomyces jeddahensis TaxID=1716141 RepID=UPI00082BBF7E|nr:hypothetical protein [Streptomyces jeddahensis]